MPTFTVHEPPPRKGETGPNPDRFVFVRDGFHFWAFLLAPLWMLLHRLWLVLLFYLLLSILLMATFAALGVPSPFRTIVGLLLGLLVGFEAATLRRWTLTRRGWSTAGVVVAEEEDEAERRFFTQWTAREDTRASAPPPVVTRPVRRGSPDGTDVIGLFPEPDKPR